MRIHAAHTPSLTEKIKERSKENSLLGAIRGLKSAALRSSLIVNFLTQKRLHLHTEVRSFRLLLSKIIIPEMRNALAILRSGLGVVVLFARAVSKNLP